MKNYIKRILAALLITALFLPFCAGAVSMTQEVNVEDDVKAAAEAVLSASAKNMWLYQSNNLVDGTVEALAETPAELFDSTGVFGLDRQEVTAYIEDISFLQEKTEYFKQVRQAQNIQRDDFQLQYHYEKPEISGNQASLYVVEHISFHYSDYPDILSEATNYYNVGLIYVNEEWLVAEVSANNDDFDSTYKGTGFTAANAEKYFKMVEEQTAKIEAEELAAEYSFVDESEIETVTATAGTWYDYDADNAAAYAYTYVTGQFGKQTLSAVDEAIGKTFYNANFKDFSSLGGDCQNFASQCIWAGFNGSNTKNQVYNASTKTFSPIMDNYGSYFWKGTIPGQSNNSTSWTLTNGGDGFKKYIEKENSSGDPDMIVRTGTIASGANFSGIYSDLMGAVLRVNASQGHAVVVTDVTGPNRSQVFFCAHTSDRKNIAVGDFYSTGVINYFIPQQIRVRNAPEVKITANLIRPVACGTSVTVGGKTDVSCRYLSVTIDAPSGDNITTGKVNATAVSREVTLDEVGLYTITIEATKDSASTPVVYVYTIRTY